MKPVGSGDNFLRDAKPRSTFLGFSHKMHLNSDYTIHWLRPKNLWFLSRHQDLFFFFSGQQRNPCSSQNVLENANDFPQGRILTDQRTSFQRRFPTNKTSLFPWALFPPLSRYAEEESLANSEWLEQSKLALFCCRLKWKIIDMNWWLFKLSRLKRGKKRAKGNREERGSTNEWNIN